MQVSKRGSLNLSINAIVILILAITMLGLGLGFMKNTFSKTTSQFDDVSEDMKSTMIEDLKSSNERLVFNKYDIEIKKGKEKEVYYAINNDNAALTTFQISFSCSTAIASGACTDEGVCESVTFQSFGSKAIGGNDVAVMKVIIGALSTATPTTYSCKANLDASGTYASKEFFVTVV